MLYYKKISSPLGEITLRSDGERLTGLWFADDKHYGDKDIQDAKNAELPVFALAEKWLAEYFAGCEPKVNVPLQFNGSYFQERVWKILQNIPYGSLITYGDIACEIAAQRSLARMSAQAVGVIRCALLFRVIALSALMAALQAMAAVCGARCVCLSWKRQI